MIYRSSDAERDGSAQYPWRILDVWGGHRDDSVYSGVLSVLGKVLVGERQAEACGCTGVSRVEGGFNGNVIMLGST